MPNIGTKSPPDNSAVVAVFVEHCAMRAYRYGQGDLTLQDAVDWLQDWAFTRGLLEHPGQDAIQAIMADAFRIYTLREAVREAQS